MRIVIIVMVLAALPVLVVFAALTPSKPPHATPYRATCCEFVAERTFEQPESVPRMPHPRFGEPMPEYTPAPFPESERQKIIEKFMRDSRYVPYDAGPCGGRSNPCHVTIDQ
jgi:hypothetical protein